jgi:hypothetical protein
MATIGISATLNNTESNVIYKAQHDAIVLSDRVISNSSNTTVNYTKILPTGENISLSNLQGIFLGKGTQLSVQASANCQVEITLISRLASKDYQIVFPAYSVQTLTFQSTIDSTVCGSCTDGRYPVIKLSGTPGSQVILRIGTANSLIREDYFVKVIEWVKAPKCPPIQENIDFKVIGLAPFLAFGNFAYTFTEPFVFISCLGEDPSQNNVEKLICLSIAQTYHPNLPAYDIDCWSFLGG